MECKIHNGLPIQFICSDKKCKQSNNLIEKKQKGLCEICLNLHNKQHKYIISINSFTDESYEKLVIRNYNKSISIKSKLDKLHKDYSDKLKHDFMNLTNKIILQIENSQEELLNKIESQKLKLFEELEIWKEYKLLFERDNKDNTFNTDNKENKENKEKSHKNQINEKDQKNEENPSINKNQKENKSNSNNTNNNIKKSNQFIYETLDRENEIQDLNFTKNSNLNEIYNTLNPIDEKDNDIDNADNNDNNENDNENYNENITILDNINSKIMEIDNDNNNDKNNYFENIENAFNRKLKMITNIMDKHIEQFVSNSNANFDTNLNINKNANEAFKNKNKDNDYDYDNDNIYCKNSTNFEHFCKILFKKFSKNFSNSINKIIESYIPMKKEIENIEKLEKIKNDKENDKDKIYDKYKYINYNTYDPNVPNNKRNINYYTYLENNNNIIDSNLNNSYKNSPTPNKNKENNANDNNRINIDKNKDKNINNNINKNTNNNEINDNYNDNDNYNIEIINKNKSVYDNSNKKYDFSNEKEKDTIFIDPNRENFSSKNSMILNFNNNGLFEIDTLRTIKNTMNNTLRSRIYDNDNFNYNNNNLLYNNYNKINESDYDLNTLSQMKRKNKSNQNQRDYFYDSESPYKSKLDKLDKFDLESEDNFYQKKLIDGEDNNNSNNNNEISNAINNNINHNTNNYKHSNNIMNIIEEERGSYILNSNKNKIEIEIEIENSSNSLNSLSIDKNQLNINKLNKNNQINENENENWNENNNENENENNKKINNKVNNINNNNNNNNNNYNNKTNFINKNIKKKLFANKNCLIENFNKKNFELKEPINIINNKKGSWYSLDYIKSHNFIVCGYENGEIVIFKESDFSLIRTYRPRYKKIRRLIYSEENTSIIAAYDDGFIVLINIIDFKFETYKKSNSQIYTFDIMKNLNILIWGGFDRNISYSNMSNMDDTYLFHESTDGEVQCIFHDLDKDVLIASFRKNTIIFFDFNQGEGNIIKQFKINENTDACGMIIKKLEFKEYEYSNNYNNNDISTIFISGFFMSIHQFEISNNKENIELIRLIQTPYSQIYDILFINMDYFLITTFDDGRIILMNAKGNNIVKVFEHVYNSGIQIKFIENKFYLTSYGDNLKMIEFKI
jgi:hypothetical protein